MQISQVRLNIIRRERWIRLAIVLAIIMLTGFVLLTVQGMLVSIVLAFVITYMFKPIVSYLERAGVDRTVSILIPFAITGFLLWLAYQIALPKITDSIEHIQAEIPRYIKGVTALFNAKAQTLSATLSKYSKIDLSEKLTAFFEETSTAVLSSLPNMISIIFSTAIMAPFFAFFMLRDGRQIVKELLGYVPNNLFELALNLVYQINQQMGGFIRARLLESLIVSAVVWLGLVIMDFPYAIVLGLIAGITNLIPYVGPIIGALPGIIIAIANGDSSTTIALLSLIYVAAQVVDMLFIIPLVIAKIVDLHPVTVVVVIIIGSQIMGILGMIISIPVASIIKLTFSVFYNHVVDFRS